MSSCPLGALSGFVQLTGPITQPILSSISVNDSPPLQFNFGPRNVPHTMYNTSYIGLTATDECIYKNKVYKNIAIQLCKPQHTGYLLPNMPTATLIAEMIVTYYRQSGDPEGIILCVPIYTKYTASNHNFLYNILDNSQELSNIPTLKSVFSSTDKIDKPSFGYHSCFYTTDYLSHNVYVLVFPHGIAIDSTYTNKLTPRLSDKYVIPFLIAGKQVVSTYTPTMRGITTSITINATSSNTMFTNDMSTSSSDFTTKIQYYKYNISLVTSREPKNRYTTSQYKCMPFNREENLIMDNGAIYVTPGETNASLQSILDENKKKREEEDSTMAQSNKIGQTIAFTAVGVVGFAFLTAIGYAAHIATKE
jgi:hypothetical protein